MNNSTDTRLYANFAASYIWPEIKNSALRIGCVPPGPSSIKHAH